MKRVIKLCLLALCALWACLVPLRAEAVETVAKGTCGDNLTWVLDDDGVLTISGDGNMVNYKSSSTTPWYSYRQKTKSITISQGVTSVGDYAFYYMSWVKSVCLPSGITSIGKSAFQYNNELTTINFPYGIVSIGEDAFDCCLKLIDVVIPDSVTTIGEDAFHQCGALKSIVVPESVVSLGAHAFSNCWEMESAVIPSTLAEIPDYLFCACYKLKSVHIPDGVTSIGEYAFYNCKALTSVDIPGGVTTIGEHAFRDCIGLTDIVIPANVSEIGTAAFAGCTGVAAFQLDLRNKHYSVVDGVLCDADHVTLLQAPGGLSGTYTIPETITSIDSYGFYGCRNLTDVIFPNGVTNIKDSAFYGCSSLINITIPYGVTCVDTGTFYECTGLNTVTIPWGVTQIKDNAFAFCKNLKEVQIPLTVSSIGYRAFYTCSSLTSMLLPEGITKIDSQTFSECTKLSTITIPQSVTEIHYAFSNCNSLKKVHYSGTQEQWEKIRISGYSDDVLTKSTKHFCSGATTEPSCTETGCVTYTCTTCNYSYVDTYLAATGHTEGKHTCDYCGKVASDCVDDAPVDHQCDICGITMGEHKAAEGKHTCGYCGKDASECADTAPVDHQCDICGATMGEHKAAEGKHTCDYCGKVASDCVDTTPVDHQCDICGTIMGEHKAAEGKHTCDYCGKVASDCVDEAPVDHQCDICGTTMGEHKAAEGSHICGYCGKAASDCIDANPADHNCDICGTKLSDCTDEDGDGQCDICGAEQEKFDFNDVMRLFGSGRWDTAIKNANELKSVLGVSKFSSIIVASGNDFADALAGSYLSNVKGAPILLSWGKGGKFDYLDTDNISYIKNNLASGGTVYILGGTGAVPSSYETLLSGFHVERLAGTNRYDTNLAILKEAGVANGSEILVCTGTTFADSLSAAATGKPIMLVQEYNGKYYGINSDFLNGKGYTFTIIGGTTAVSDSLATELNKYGTVERLAGGNRFETSVLVAERFFDAPDSAVLAYAWNYPDGLCGGALAYAMHAPLILTMDKWEGAAAQYVQSNGITSGIILGGTGLISDAAVRTIYALDPSTQIPLK